MAVGNPGLDHALRGGERAYKGRGRQRSPQTSPLGRAGSEVLATAAGASMAVLAIHRGHRVGGVASEFHGGAPGPPGGRSNSVGRSGTLQGARLSNHPASSVSAAESVSDAFWAARRLNISGGRRRGGDRLTLRGESHSLTVRRSAASGPGGDGPHQRLAGAAVTTYGGRAHRGKPFMATLGKREVKAELDRGGPLLHHGQPSCAGPSIAASNKGGAAIPCGARGTWPAVQRGPAAPQTGR